MANGIFNLEEQLREIGIEKIYSGKVRDLYTRGEDLIMVASDRISAFDHILSKSIPFKGQILNTIASRMLDSTADIVPNWKKEMPHPNVTIGKRCESIKIEMVVRGYLTGHAWRVYNSGLRELCGVKLPNGLYENDPFQSPIITPATKAEEGHDEDISGNAIVSRGIVSDGLYKQMCEVSLKLFERGTKIAEKQGLILVDTKYEFGLYKDQLHLIDEVHTPDSSRYFFLDNYAKNQSARKPQRHLSKEFVREWLMAEGFQGLENQTLPAMDLEVVERIQKRYMELYSTLMSEEFEPEPVSTLVEKIKLYYQN